MYFRPDVELRANVQRGVLFTNANFIRRDAIELPLGKLSPSTLLGESVSAATLELTEYLEAVGPDGQPEVLVATGGSDLVDDYGDVLSFGLNVTFSRDPDLVRRLVGAPRDDRDVTQP